MLDFLLCVRVHTKYNIFLLLVCWRWYNWQCWCHCYFFGFSKFRIQCVVHAHTYICIHAHAYAYISTITELLIKTMRSHVMETRWKFCNELYKVDNRRNCNDFLYACVCGCVCIYDCHQLKYLQIRLPADYTFYVGCTLLMIQTQRNEQ